MLDDKAVLEYIIDMVNAVKKVQKRYVLHTRIRCKKNMRIELEAAVRLTAASNYL